jgi:hypothetical protein
VFAEAHGIIGQMSAPQRRTGRRPAPRPGAPATDHIPPITRLGVGPQSGAPGSPALGAEHTISVAPLGPSAPDQLRRASAADAGSRALPDPATRTQPRRPRRPRPAQAPSARTRKKRQNFANRERRDQPAVQPHPLEIAALLHELTARLLGADDVPQALDRLAAFGAQALPGTLRCSVALIGEGGPPTLATSGPAAQALDDLQYATGEGPALEAARSRSIITAEDLPADDRWPELAECATLENVRSVAAIPLDIQRSAVGSVSFFATEPGTMNPELLLTAMTLVNHAEILLGELQRRQGRHEGAAVDRAAGVIIAQRGCGVQEAYDVLRDTAQRLGLPRAEVAERLIAAAARRAE